jgi:hypothetical protein
MSCLLEYVSKSELKIIIILKISLYHVKFDPMGSGSLYPGQT